MGRTVLYWLGGARPGDLKQNEETIRENSIHTIRDRIYVLCIIVWNICGICSNDCYESNGVTKLKVITGEWDEAQAVSPVQVTPSPPKAGGSPQSTRHLNIYDKRIRKQ